MFTDILQRASGTTQTAQTKKSRAEPNYAALLAAQLKFQNPLEPAKTNETAALMASMGQTQTLERMSSLLEALLVSKDSTSFLGKTAGFQGEAGMKAKGGEFFAVKKGSEDEFRINGEPWQKDGIIDGGTHWIGKMKNGDEPSGDWLSLQRVVSVDGSSGELGGSLGGRSSTAETTIFDVKID